MTKEQQIKIQRCIDEFYSNRPQVRDELGVALQVLCEAEPRWIPVTERLPEECEEVNITWVNTEPCSYYANIKGKPFTGSGLYCRGRWFWYSATCKDYLEDYGFAQGDEMDDVIKVIAWMPLPEPYREGEE